MRTQSGLHQRHLKCRPQGIHSWEYRHLAGNHLRTAVPRASGAQCLRSGYRESEDAPKVLGKRFSMATPAHQHRAELAILGTPIVQTIRKGCMRDANPGEIAK